MVQKIICRTGYAGTCNDSRILLLFVNKVYDVLLLRIFFTISPLLVETTLEASEMMKNINCTQWEKLLRFNQKRWDQNLHFPLLPLLLSSLSLSSMVCRLGNTMYVTVNTEAITWGSITYEMTSDAWYYATVTWHIQSGLILYINGNRAAQLDGKERVHR